MVAATRELMKKEQALALETYRSVPVKELLGVVARQWEIVLFSYLLLVIVSGLYCFFWPPTYEAAARLLVKNDRQDPLLSADQDSIRTQSRSLVTEEDLNTESAILQSGEVLRQAVVSTGVDRMGEHWLMRLINIPLNEMSRIYKSYHRKKEADAVVRGVARLQKKLQVAPEKRSNVIAMRVQWGDPDQAAMILRGMIDAYMKLHMTLRETSTSQLFFQQQLEAKRADLDAIDRQIKAIRPGRSLTVLSEEERHKVSAVADLDGERRRFKAKTDELASRAQEIQHQLDTLPETITLEERWITNPIARGNLKAQVLELQRKRAELQTKYKEDNLFVVQNRKELEAAEAMLRTETETPATERTTSVNKVAEALKQELALTKANFEAAKVLTSRTENDVKALSGELNNLSRQGDAMRKLERERQSTLAALEVYERRFEEARVTAALNFERLLNVTLIEPIQSNPDVVKPKIGLIMKLSLGFGLLVGVSMAFLVDSIKGRIYTSYEVERAIGVTVLAELETHWADPRNFMVPLKDSEESKWKP